MRHPNLFVYCKDTCDPLGLYYAKNEVDRKLESLRAKLPKWHRCDEPDEDGFFDLPPESGSYFAQYETTLADGTTKRYCEPLEYDADVCDWPQLTNHCRVIQWSENPTPPEL